MRASIAIVLAGTILTATPALAGSVVSYPRSGFSCTCRHVLHGVNSLKKLPDSLRLTLSPAPGAMADQDEDFNSGDVVEPNLPFSGFFWAGRNGRRWYVLSFQNDSGFDHTEIRVFEEPQPGTMVEIAFGYLEPGEDPCGLIDHVIDGTQRLWPPRSRKP